ncbi:hypothetical protein N9I13_00450 [bacterium]|jgi:hypothetical protein|nr:hypothetical protein [bacterium]|tara:strand:- start:744 stop:1124 length:381 start_codon:yes stop_codon:yes gene_type:complete
MKKLLLILLTFTILIGCAKDDEFLEPITNEEIPQSLQIKELIGIKLENTIVTDRVAMNVKLPLDGKYRIKIRHGINNELISQEMIEAEEGDNLLRVYVASLDKSGYMIQLTDEFHNVLGNQSFVVN